jgi:hypothetical protein
VAASAGLAPLPAVDSVLGEVGGGFSGCFSGGEPWPEGPLPGNPEGYGPLELLVIQPTPYCNLDCDYCYLPSRGDRTRLSLEILDAALERVLESPFVGGDFTLLWRRDVNPAAVLRAGTVWRCPARA